MKNISLSLISTLLFCAFSSAMPRIGDTATYSGTVQYQGQNYQARITQTITQFNSSTDQYTVQRTTEVQGSSNTESEMVQKSDLLSADIIQNLLGQCSQANGVLEQVSAPAGNFSTCRLTSDDGSIVNLGMVPFGVVKVRSSQADLQIERFSFGQ